MIKKIIKKTVNFFGIDIIRYRSEKEEKTRRTGRLAFFKTTTGNYYLPADARGDVIVHHIRNNKIFEEEVVSIACKYIKEGSAVLDVGANFGQMSILFSNATGATGKVYSFDADDFVFDVLKKNIIANNREKNIIPVFGAVSNKEGEIVYFPVQDFKKYGTYGSYGIDRDAKEGREVKTITIDSLAIKEPVSFMKIDIQGFDLEAMQGAVQTITKNRMPVLFEYEYQLEEACNLSFQKYVDFVRSINYKFEKVLNGHNFLIVPV